LLLGEKSKGGREVRDKRKEEKEEKNKRWQL
jgi:hypothetical protein